MFEHMPPPPGTEITSADVDPATLDELVVAIIGYGTMGRAHALNLVRSKRRVIVGSRPGSRSGQRARDEGLKVKEVAAAVAAGDIVMLMLPDEAMAEVYAADVAPHLRDGAALGFAHGFAVAFGQIKPAPGTACFLAAPKGQGDMLLQAHAAGGGLPGLVAVGEESPRETWPLALAYAEAVGCLVGGGFVTTFRDECVSDQFGEQAVLCGGVIELLKSAFDIMVDAGYGEENAYFECVHELKLITDLVHRHGVDGMRGMISGTAAYGGLTRGPRIIDAGVRERMRTILKEIETGSFSDEFLARHTETPRLAAEEAAGSLARAGQKMLPRLHPDRGREQK